jgi:hypothetical protein
MTILLTLLVVIGLWLLLRRANELCMIRIRHGGVRLVRGRAPSRLLHDIGEIARRAEATDARVRIVSESGSPAVYASGSIADATLQQLRNVVSEHRVPHFRTGRRAGT